MVFLLFESVLISNDLFILKLYYIYIYPFGLSDMHAIYIYIYMILLSQ